MQDDTTESENSESWKCDDFFFAIWALVSGDSGD